MTVKRIAAIALPPPVVRLGAPHVGPAAGDTLRLTLGHTFLDEVLATTPDGQPLRLAGLGAAAPHLATGDVLLVRVLSTHPRLELALFDTPGRHADGRGAALPKAMQPDQLAQRQMRWRPPDAAAVAQSWRTMVLSHVDAATARSGASYAVTPAAGPHATGTLVIGREPMAAPPGTLSAHPDRWLFPAYAWGGLQVTLRLVDLDDDAPPPRRRRGPMALSLEVDLPALGRVAVLVRLLAGGVQLIFFVDDAWAQQPVRDALPMLSRALGASGLRLVGCGVARGMPPAGATTRLDERGGLTPTQLLPSPLFHAAAEVAVALSALLPAEGLRPVARPGQ